MTDYVTVVCTARDATTGHSPPGRGYCLACHPEPLGQGCHIEVAAVGFAQGLPAAAASLIGRVGEIAPLLIGRLATSRVAVPVTVREHTPGSPLCTGNTDTQEDQGQQGAGSPPLARILPGLLPKWWA